MRTDWPWMEDETLAWDPQSATGAQIAQDHVAATDWYRSFRQSRKQLDPVSLEVSASEEHPRGPAGMHLQHSFSEKEKNKKLLWLHSPS